MGLGGTLALDKAELTCRLLCFLHFLAGAIGREDLLVVGTEPGNSLKQKPNRGMVFRDGHSISPSLP